MALHGKKWVKIALAPPILQLEYVRAPMYLCIVPSRDVKLEPAGPAPGPKSGPAVLLRGLSA